MTPAARVAAAIHILDEIFAADAAEKVLTGWGRKNRYAGSGDRAAIRDHVYDALRCRRSFGYLGGGDSGRALMIGRATALDLDLSLLFSGDKYAPHALGEAESLARDLSLAPRGVRLDCPDWLLDRFDARFGADADAVLTQLQRRAPVFLRVNSTKSSRAAVQGILGENEIVTQPHPLSDTALEVTQNPRRVAQNAAYKDGLVEFQDAASQAVVDFLPLQDGDRVLDFCAGGGGKSLAMAARANILLLAHDVTPSRMQDLPVRAARAGANIVPVDGPALHGQKFDLVLCDVPCSGSGSWRRTPNAKWTLTPARLAELCDIQASVLDRAGAYVGVSGVLAFVTCSVFDQENHLQIEKFLSRSRGWRLLKSRNYSLVDGGDGFYVALIARCIT